MNDFKKLLEKYADIAIKIGINIEPNQTLVINSPIECAEFVRIIANKAYDAGAKNVHVKWNDEELSLIKYMKAPFETFEEFPAWEVEELESLAKENAAFLSISASNPELLKNVDPEKIATSNKTRGRALKKYYEYIMNSFVSWCVLSVPTKAWAKKVFPDLKEDMAVEKLWENIFNIVRIDKEDPIKAWEKHLNNLADKVNFLNDQRLTKLHYKSKDTDLTIELPKGHIWCGGGEYNKNKRYFVANMPTEEVFTLPLKTGVNGIVKSTKPLNYSGNLINNFTLKFENGRIIDFSAEEGYETLKKLIETDEGSCYLGEVALVPFHSPISDSNIIFYNTLFDENASCHLALGEAYPTCIENGDNMTKEELEKAGANNSLTHVDFMIGSSDLDIIGENKKGEKIEIFQNGDWAF
ncbi:aminopeptidase [Clostridium botulinum]|uniref:Aminopeptidase n=1 Tax=Clostridium botulinum (strain Okra / Type B1) TaxID=498213 RepID=B1IKK7_CLOBK|nr:aminopeptidase [Clostridium botulinum]ACA46524.1 aminopeptidase [Clostridium botulinum B1 str. Okra]MBD5563137.1 aminopeptidase [Clostridium botulinum]MBD5567220.1 aminopeptidase [Clostridium botulinum]MBD5570167.1 aminopeptidase [Clostridium botulinum]MBD5574120.1 aminopeptidase [Clostridium botulinum]